MSVLRFFILVFLFAASASADIIRIEGGVGAFSAKPGGTFDTVTGGTFGDIIGNHSVDLKDDLGIGTENDPYVWAYIKHPIPIVPNVRVEYLSLKHTPDAKKSFEVNELDGILYYNLLDNTAFITLDLGIDIKYIETDQEDSDTSTIGLLYSRLRVEPLEWLGIEGILKLTGYNENKGYDARLKLDYTMTFIPVVQPAIELGYRIHDIEYEIGNVINKADYRGVYGGLMVRF